MIGACYHRGVPRASTAPRRPCRGEGRAHSGAGREQGRATARRGGSDVRGHWWRLGAALALLVFLLGGVAACGDDDDGGDKDVDKIKSRMESFTNHINKADAKGLINDLPPSIRKDCDEQKIKQGAEELKSLGLKVKD